MNITKEQIKEWVDNQYKNDPNRDTDIGKAMAESLVVLIDNCFNDLSPKWVSVDDELPDNTKAVLVYVASTQGPSFIEIDHFVNGEFHFQALSKCNSVTHWMPLTPPK